MGSNVAMSGDFDASFEFDLLKMTPPKAGLNSGVYLQIEVPDEQQHQYSVILVGSPEETVASWPRSRAHAERRPGVSVPGASIHRPGPAAAICPSRQPALISLCRRGQPTRSRARTTRPAGQPRYEHRHPHARTYRRRRQHHGNGLAKAGDQRQMRSISTRLFASTSVKESFGEFNKSVGVWPVMLVDQ